MSDYYAKTTYFAISLDPIHIGNGGARLGRVDLPIVKEPGTNLPKIPATSLNGPARAYTALSVNRYRWEENGIEYACAGKGGERGEKHCGKINPACPVCVPYGFSKGSRSLQGLAQFFDAHILLFPVLSMIGPVWITSPLTLEKLSISKDELKKLEDNKYYPIGNAVKNFDKLNFGWLLLEKNSTTVNLDKPFNAPFPDYIKERAILVPDSLFPIIVNSNLEVRISVSIDPTTGAAEEGALFTYEAIPRSTIFCFDVVYNSGKLFKLGNEEIKAEGNADVGPKWVQTQVEKGLRLFEILGIGGMNTRGMGRLKILNLSTQGGAEHE